MNLKKIINIALVITIIASVCIALRMNILYEKCKKKPAAVSAKAVENLIPLVDHHYTGKPILK